MSELIKPQWFQILLALSQRDLHGYAIQRSVLEQTDDGMRLWPAMLYRSLEALEAAGLIAAVDAPVDEPSDERRQYYTLTGHGRERLAQQVELLDRWVRAARAQES